MELLRDGRCVPFQQRRCSNAWRSADESMTDVRDVAAEEGMPTMDALVQRPKYVVGERVGVLKAQQWTTGTVTAISGSAADGTLRYEVDALDPPSDISTVHLVDKEESELRRYVVDTGGWRGGRRQGRSRCNCGRVDWQDKYNDWTSAAVRMRWKQTWGWLIGVR